MKAIFTRSFLMLGMVTFDAVGDDACVSFPCQDYNGKRQIRLGVCMEVSHGG